MKVAAFTTTLPHLLPEEAVAVLSAQGWDGVEWRIQDETPAETPSYWSGNRCSWPSTGLEDHVPRIRDVCVRSGLAMPALGTYVQWDDAERLNSTLRAAQKLGVASVRVQVPLRGGAYAPLFRTVKRTLPQIQGLAEQHGVKILIETHPGTLAPSVSAALRIMEDTDPEHIGLLYNIGNLCVEGYEDPVALLPVLGPRLAHVHLKNAYPEPPASASHDSAWQWRWAPLQEGMLDLQAFIGSLMTTGYDRWLTISDFSISNDPVVRAGENLAFVRSAIMHASGATHHSA